MREQTIPAPDYQKQTLSVPMKNIVYTVALCGFFLASFPASASAETVAECGDNLRECIRKSNIEWRRTHDTDELEQSHTMCNVEWAICTLAGLL